jgi:hypothetical protein
MIEVYIWEPGSFTIGSGISQLKTSDWVADWKKALGHASMYISSTDTYLSLWPTTNMLEGLPSLEQLKGGILNTLQNFHGPGVIKESLMDDIDGMGGHYTKGYNISITNEEAVAQAAEEYIRQIENREKGYNLVYSNCSTAVFNALYVGMANLDRDRVRDFKAFSNRAFALLKNTAIFAGQRENFNGLDFFQTQGWEPLKLVFALQELSTFRTPLAICEYLEGMKAFNE